MTTEPTETAPKITVEWEGHDVDAAKSVTILAQGLGGQLANLLERHVEDCIAARVTVAASALDDVARQVWALVLKASAEALGKRDSEAVRLIRAVTVTRDALAPALPKDAPKTVPEFSEMRAVIERDANGQAVAVRTIKATTK